MVEAGALRVTDAFRAHLETQRVCIVSRVYVDICRDGNRQRSFILRVGFPDDLLRYELRWRVPSSLVFLRVKSAIICEMRRVFPWHIYTKESSLATILSLLVSRLKENTFESRDVYTLLQSTDEKQLFNHYSFHKYFNLNCRTEYFATNRSKIKPSDRIISKLSKNTVSRLDLPIIPSSRIISVLATIAILDQRCNFTFRENWSYLIKRINFFKTLTKMLLSLLSGPSQLLSYVTSINCE